MIKCILYRYHACLDDEGSRPAVHTVSDDEKLPCTSVITISSGEYSQAVAEGSDRLGGLLSTRVAQALLKSTNLRCSLLL